MAISHIGSQGNAGTTVTIPAHEIGDLILIFAYRDGSNTTPSVPAAGGTVPTWTIIGTASGANTNSSRLHYAVATATNTTSGTWTNATELIAVVYRGTRRPGGIGATGGSGTLISYPAVTMQRSDNTSWVAGFAGHRTATNVEGAPSGMTNRTSAGTEVANHDTAGTVSSWSATSVTVSASSGWRARTVELLDAALSLSAEAGSFTQTGIDAGLVKAYKLTAGPEKFFLPERNIARRSEQLNDATWVKNKVGTLPIAPVVTANQDVAPDGTLTADRVVFDLNGSVTTNDRSQIEQLIPTVVGRTYTFSTWMRSADGISRVVRISLAGLGAVNVTVTSSWQRFSTTAVAFDTTRYPRISLRVGSGSSDYADLYIWGAQYEEGLVSDYDPTGPNAAVITRVRHTARLVADGGAYNANGIDADLSKTGNNIVLAADAGSCTLTGIAAGVSHNARLLAEARAFAVTGNLIDLRPARRLLAEVRAYTLTGIAADLRETARLVAEARAFSVTGVSAFPRPGRRLTAQTGALTLTGVSADLIKAGSAAQTLVADVGALTLTGIQAGVYRGRRLVADVRAFTLSGQAAGIRQAVRIAGQAGSLLIQSPGAAFKRGFILSAAGGSVSLTGQSSDRSRSFRLVASTSAPVVIIGEPQATIRAARLLGLSVGSLSVLGSSAILTANTSFVVDLGSAGVSGLPVTFRRTYIIRADSEFFQSAGNDSYNRIRQIPVPAKKYAGNLMDIEPYFKARQIPSRNRPSGRGVAPRF